MTRRVWANLILLLIVVVLGVVAYLEPGSEPAEKPVPLLSLAPSQVEHIRLQRQNAPDILLERTASSWMLIEPLRVAASDYRIDTLLQLMTATSYSHFPVSLRPLAGFGLEEPLATVTFNDQSIEFGSSEPLHNRRYVRVDDQVHLIDERHFYQSQLLLTALVDTALLPPGRTLSGIVLPGLRLQHQDGDWHLSDAAGKLDPDVSMDAINGLVDEWRHARAVQVSRYQADVAESVIVLTFADGESMQLELLARDPELILGRRELGLRYHFTPDQADRLLSLSPVAGNGAD